MTDVATSAAPDPKPPTENEVRDLAARRAVGQIRKALGNIPVIVVLPASNEDRLDKGQRVGPFVAYDGDFASVKGIMAHAQAPLPPNGFGNVRLEFDDEDEDWKAGTSVD